MPIILGSKTTLSGDATGTAKKQTRPALPAATSTRPPATLDSRPADSRVMESRPTPSTQIEALSGDPNFIARTWAGGDSGIFAAQAAADRFANQQQDRIFTRGGSTVFVHAIQTWLCRFRRQPPFLFARESARIGALVYFLDAAGGRNATHSRTCEPRFARVVLDRHARWIGHHLHRASQRNANHGD